jgi:hypothetical protein
MLTTTSIVNTRFYTRTELYELGPSSRNQSSTREMVVQMYNIYLWSHQTKVSTTVKQVEIGEKTVLQMYHAVPP